MLIPKSFRVVAVAATAALVVSACQSSESTTDADPTSTATTSATPSPEPTEPTPDIGLFESGPNSPIAYGLEVPDGATQLGPLTLIRSERLIAAYAPELQAAAAQRAATERAELAEQQAEDPTAEIPEPTPTPDDRPSDDSFNALDEEPRPDTVISVMRVDGNPTVVVRRMLAQLTALLPDTEVPTDLASWCDSDQRRITDCRIGLSGATAEGRDVRVVLAINPGDVATRTSPPSALRQPVMMLQVKYIGDAREGQTSRESNDLGDVPDIAEGPDPTGLIWPSMDVDASSDTPLVSDFVVPSDVTILLSGFEPSFVELTTDKAATADELAEAWVAERADGPVAKDVAVELNEVNTTYSGRASNAETGDTYFRATYVLSARGNYVLLMVYPPGYTY